MNNINKDKVNVDIDTTIDINNSNNNCSMSTKTNYISQNPNQNISHNYNNKKPPTSPAQMRIRRSQADLLEDISVEHKQLLEDAELSGNGAHELNRLIDDMTSTLPKSCVSLRDKNNNHYSSSNHSNNNSATNIQLNGPDDEDEVQAVMVTGCGSRIGRQIAVAFAAMDLKVALVDFDTNQTEFVAMECEQKSPSNRVPLQIVADISQLDEAHKVIDQTIKEFGRLDVLINTVNDAALMDANFTGSEEDAHVFEQYNKIMAKNMHSITYLCISASPHLRKTRGSIVNVSSITNNENGSYKFAYCMSKAGILTLTKSLATDLAPDIKVKHESV